MQVNTFQKRKSVRRFMPTEIEPSRLKELMQFGDNLPFISQKLTRQAVWLFGKEAIGSLLSQFLLSYGKLVSSPYIFVPFYETTELTPLEIGFALEHLVLKATEMGIGSLWLSIDEHINILKDAIFNASFAPEDEHLLKIINKSTFKKDKILTSMQLPVVLLLGYASEKRLDRIINNAIRMESAGNSRRKIDSIIINRRMEVLPDKVRKALNLAVLAPSKKNQQPWRLRTRKDGLDLGYLHQRQLDLGIFIAHLKIALEHFGIDFRLEIYNEKSNDIDWCVKIFWK